MADLPASSTSDSLRRNNAATLVRSLRVDGPASRADLATRTGLAKATVGTIAAALESAGVVRESEQVRRGERGRPSVLLTLAGGRPVGLGFEVNVEYVAAVALDLAGVVRHEATRPVGPGGVVDALSVLAGEVGTALLAADLDPVGATVALPGLVGGDDRTAVWVPNLDVSGTAVVDAVDAALGWDGRTRATNDADCSALAEMHHGAGRGTDHLLYLTGTVGIGAGLVDGARLLRGARGFAGEVGHLPVGEPDARCGCGRTGCWEASVGLHALLDAVGMREVGTPQETAAAVAAAAQGEASAALAVREGIDRVGRWLGRGLAIVSGVVDPGTIVLGGYFASLGELILGPAADELAATLASSTLGVPDLRPGLLGTGSAATGAAEHALADVLSGAADLV